jgi:hypothetical protein
VPHSDAFALYSTSSVAGYVNGFVDRHGKARYYFRRAGFKKVALPGVPWSPDFMAAYQTVLAGQPIAIGEDRTLPGSMQALSISYYGSAQYWR